jgi:hypothetical protein
MKSKNVELTVALCRGSRRNVAHQGMSAVTTNKSDQNHVERPACESARPVDPTHSIISMFVAPIGVENPPSDMRRITAEGISLNCLTDVSLALSQLHPMLS